MTHRQFSRNASSSRAIPVEKFLAWVNEDPAMPLEYRLNQKGMQGGELMDEETKAACEAEILKLRDQAVSTVKRLSELGLAKQSANRYAEPWHHISVLITATNFANFFALRIHKDAQPEIREIALHMLLAYETSEPEALAVGDWHLPFVGRSQLDRLLSVENQIKSSVARCARVSYNNHDGSAPDPIKDVALHDALVVQKPLHASPAEHQVQVTQLVKPEWFGNFPGHWMQYRKSLPAEVVTEIPQHCYDMLRNRFPGRTDPQCDPTAGDPNHAP